MNIEYGTFCKTQSTDNVANTLLCNSKNEVKVLNRVLLLLFFLLAGCTTTSDMQGLTSGHIGCHPNEITIKNPSNSSVTNNWTAVCKGKTYICNQDMSGFSPTVSCTERNK